MSPARASMPQCHNCKKIFMSVGALRNHKQTKICASTTCQNCSKVFKCRSGLLSHLRSKKCHLTATNSSSSTAKKTKSCVCEICNELFRDYFSLREHRRRHDSSLRLKCRACPSTFASAATLRKHLKEIHGLEPEKQTAPKRIHCQLCNLLVTRERLIVHLAKCHHKLMTGKLRVGPDQEIICNLCHAAVKCIKYGEHKSQHLDSRNFGRIKCEECPLTFNWESSYDRHLLFHRSQEWFILNPDPWSCRKCGQFFKTYSTMKYHRSKCEKFPPSPSEKNKQSLQCHNCKRIFKSVQFLRNHEQTKICTRTTCQNCRKIFKCRSGLLCHLRSKTCQITTKNPGSSTKNKRKRCVCEICKEIFRDYYSLREHRRRHDSSLRLKCRACPSTFASAATWRKHLKEIHGLEQEKHTTPKRIQCQLCNCVVTRERLIVHLAKCHHKLMIGKLRVRPEQEIICSLCGDTVKCIKYGEHKSQHLDSRNFGRIQCAECPLTFNWESSYERHLLFHRSQEWFILNPDPWSCRKCGQHFKTFPLMEFHRRKCEKSSSPLQKNKQSLQCRNCKRIFRNIETLATHTRNQVCSNVSCQQCGKTFKTRPAMLRHVKQKTCSSGLKPDSNYSKRIKKTFSCETCGENFLQYSLLLEHKNRHENLSLYQCYICTLKFVTSKNLTTHLKKTHGEIRKRTSFRRHAKTIECQICANYFDSSMLFAHLAKCHHALMIGNMSIGPEDETKCNHCQATVKWGSYCLHLSLHLAESRAPGPIKCKLCTLSFNHQSTYDKHMFFHRSTQWFQENPNPWKCQKCGMVFKTYLTMKGHERKCDHSILGTSQQHSKNYVSDIDFQTIPEEFQHNCFLCKKKFTCWADYEIHRGTPEHEDKVNEQGAKSFRQSTGNKRITRNLANKEFETPAFPCSQCPFVAKTYRDIIQHVKQELRCNKEQMNNGTSTRKGQGVMFVFGHQPEYACYMCQAQYFDLEHCRFHVQHCKRCVGLNINTNM